MQQIIAEKDKTIANLQNTGTKLKLTLADKALDGNLLPTSTPPPPFSSPSYASVYKNPSLFIHFQLFSLFFFKYPFEMKMKILSSMYLDIMDKFP